MTEPEAETETQVDAPPHGKFYFENGATYEGEWKFLDAPETTPEEEKPRVRHGKGSPVLPSPPLETTIGTYREGDYAYEGDWVEDQMEGTGEFRFASGSSYRGEFKANVYHGDGTYKWPDGTSYTGTWKEGKMHGEGSYTDTNGKTWDGAFYNGSGPGLKCVI